ncbi:type IV pili methyl-accepting chemotaxis transducer PilJ [Candidatus Moduliflexus flocculans]|uniref:Type IV pili methyl-accepting chemotaxis transducer PilJ n=1 Tax=Candidatus Moduliflexus flocculans TaxID=1499966 RepID=A0A081BQM7_9BACT|nr:type IV pili methyl-accepting chemotaxis transducer PilJ [Candidatus Moduliflexus flocculans]
MNDAQRGKLTTQEAVSGMNAIQGAVEEFFAIVKRLGERSEEVGDTLEVIRDIADHTTLLAINAAIISAHAGEHGRDFAVIANEIGKFAERTQDSATEIEELLQTISHEFADATSAMGRLSKAILEGTTRTRDAENAFDMLRGRLLTMNEVVNRMMQTSEIHGQENQRIRETLGEVEFMLHDRQDRIASMVWQLMQIVVQMRTIHATQAENQRHLADTTQHLRQVSQDIEQVTHQSAQVTEQLVGTIGYVKKLTHRTNLGAEKASQLSQEFLEIGGNLVFTMGEFTTSSVTSELRIPEGGRPIIAFVKRGTAQFFDLIEEGVRQEATSQGFDILGIDSLYETTSQIEQVNWLLKLPMLRGVILCPTDPHIAQKLVQKGFAAGIPFVAADETIATTFSIRSGNREGGRQAAELLMAHLPPHATVGVFVDRSVESMVRRTLGFRQKAEQYPFDLIEIPCDVIQFDKLKQTMISGIQQYSEIQGIFLSCERVTTAYLQAFHENLLPSQKLLAVGYDQTPLVEQAIKNAELVGAIFQHPEEIGRQAFRQLYKLIAQHVRIDEQEDRSIYIPTRQVTKENLETVLMPGEAARS